jgi:predicted transcriptional regulator
MSTVTEIREAISKLNAQDRYLLMAQLFATMPEPDENDPELLAALDEGLADEAAGRVYSIDEVRAMIPQWISKSPSQKEP